MSRCILCTPFLFTCYDQACLLERVWGNVCISWSNGGDFSGEDSPSESLGCLPYFVASPGIKKNTILQGISSVTLLSIHD
jgi:hypothetical protein